MTATAEPRYGTPATTGRHTPDKVLRRTLRQHAAGVTVITVPGPSGFTATSFTSVSLDPALVSFCLGVTASTSDAVRQADRFAVHVLGAGNTALAEQFARSGIDRFAGVQWSEDAGGLPLLHGVPAWLTARLTHHQQLGDHLLVVGQVETGDAHLNGSPLVHHDGAFRTTSAPHLPG
jgi:flavin reductase (DIM6/NTAB) family NADH-FMN oxidoreductase RutF